MSNGESEVRDRVLSRGQDCKGRSLTGGEIKVGRSILKRWVTGGVKGRKRGGGDHKSQGDASRSWLEVRGYKKKSWGEVRA